MEIRVKTVGELKPVLKDSNLPPDNLPAYYMLGKPGENITILLPQMLGEEFSKTYGHYHLHQTEEIYTVVYGEGLILLQKVNPAGKVVEIRLATAFKGETVKIPGDCGHALINIGASPLITVDNYNPQLEEHDYDTVTAKHGLGYYIIKDEESGWKAEANPHYQNLPPLKDNPSKGLSFDNRCL